MVVHGPLKLAERVKDREEELALTLGHVGPGKRARIDHRAPRLLWRQVADDLRADMDSGELEADARLPGELELADQYGVSRDTIRRAIQELVSEGRLVVLHRRGTWALAPPGTA